MTFKKDYNTINESGEELTSRINAAGLINSTLEKLWSESYIAMANGNYNLWNTKLDSIWAILGGDVKDNDDTDKKMYSINLKIYETGSLKSKEGEGFSKKPNENNSMQYLLLLKKALFLRRLQNSQGKGTAYETKEDDWD